MSRSIILLTPKNLDHGQSMTSLALSPLRYPGGKSKALDRILPLLPTQIGEFREPFVGGGSVALAVKKLFQSRISRYWINDLNYDLYCFWKFARDSMALLAGEIQAYKANYQDGRARYQFMLDEANMRSDFDRAVRFFIMNRITFSGVVDAGGYSQQAFERRFTPSSIEKLRAVEYYLQGMEITQHSYEVLLQAPGDNVLIFLDPPYWSATDSRLYGVRGKLHTAFDHEQFADEMRRCPHRWLITYDDSDKIRSLFSFADVHLIEWQHQYGMNNYKQATAAKGHELFIKNF